MLSIGRVLRSKSRSYLLHRPQRILSTSSTKVSTSSSTSDLEFDLDNVTKSLESTLSSVPEQTAREFDMMSFLRSSSTQDRQEFRNEIEALKREEVRCRESGESDRERMIRQRRQEIDELNGLEKAMEDYSEMKNVLYDLGKASSFKAEQKLLVSWYVCFIFFFCCRCVCSHARAHSKGTLRSRNESRRNRKDVSNKGITNCQGVC